MIIFCNTNVTKQASNRRLYNLQNEWILFDRHGNPDKTDSREIASHSFRTFMNQSYAMPDSRVYLLIEVGRHVWEVWDGFRSSVVDQVRVSKVGVMTPDRVEFKHSDRTDFRRAVLSASTVVSTRADIMVVIDCNQYWIKDIVYGLLGVRVYEKNLLKSVNSSTLSTLSYIVSIYNNIIRVIDLTRNTHHFFPKISFSFLDTYSFLKF